jgi:Rps23 Pro-64 3,4-dihydroxylase Tpa1-like proline 4-hydroxylase
MKSINVEKLLANKQQLIDQWNDPKKPFKYFVYDGLLNEDFANKVVEEFPSVNNSKWENTTFINQKNKYTKTVFDESEPHLIEAFKDFNCQEFIDIISEITGIDQLLPDNDLFGGGLHQSIKGAFLDVHVDFNIHPKTKFHRRMNMIVYLNKDWQISYNGFLELWDMKKNVKLADVSPDFNRCVIFETNEVSFHGHPKKVNTPDEISRKSLAIYYYTKDRDESEIAADHNTIYMNTEGTKGKVKNILSGLTALKERIFK